MTNAVLFLLIMCVVGCSGNCRAQNLVPNGSFEEYTNSECLEWIENSSAEHFHCVKYWDKCIGLPDYVHLNHKAHDSHRHLDPKDGVAMAGAYLARYGEVSEMIYVKLREPLKQGQEYKASVFVSKDLKHYPASTDGIAMLFTSEPVCASLQAAKGQERSIGVLNMKPQVIQAQGDLLQSRARWMEVSGTFEAAGGEAYLCLGLFRFGQSDLNGVVYYYFDDVRVEGVRSAADMSSELTSGGTLRMGGLNFATGSAEIMTTAMGELVKLVDCLKSDTNLRILISGHTDSNGIHEDNNELSLQRAMAVKDYLCREGIANDRISTLGWGGVKPIAPNDSPEGRAFNRRIEISRIE